MTNPKCCDALQNEFPASRQTMPSPMSRKKARSWPSARGAQQDYGGEGGRRQGEDRGDYGFRLRALGQKREDERPQSPAGQNGCRRDARDARIAQPTRIRTLQPSRTRTHQSYHPRAVRGQPGGKTSYVKVRPFGGRDPRGAAYGVRTSWEHGADGLRAVPGVYDLRTGDG